MHRETDGGHITNPSCGDRLGHGLQRQRPDTLDVLFRPTRTGQFHGVLPAGAGDQPAVRVEEHGLASGGPDVEPQERGHGQLSGAAREPPGTSHRCGLARRRAGCCAPGRRRSRRPCPACRCCRPPRRGCARAWRRAAPAGRRCRHPRSTAPCRTHSFMIGDVHPRRAALDGVERILDADVDEVRDEVERPSHRSA